MSGDIAPIADWVETALLLAVRIGAVFLATPVLGGAWLPARVRILWILAFSALLVAATSSLPHAEGLAGRPAIHGVGALLSAVLAEAAIGATLGLGVMLAFAAFEVAGRLLSIQIGFGLGQALDPTSGLPEPALSSLMKQAAVLVFLLVDGHHGLVRGIAYSLERFPLGRPWAVEVALEPMLRVTATMVSLGFAIAGPVVLAILLLDLALGTLARTLPQLNVLMLGIPLKAVLGLVALSMWSGGASGAMTRVYGSVYGAWEEIFLSRGEAPGDAGPLLSARGPKRSGIALKEWAS